MAKKLDPLDALKAMGPPGRKIKKNWTHDLPPEQRAKLEQFRNDYHAGEFKGWTDGALWGYWNDLYLFTIEKSAFYNWLKKRQV